MKSNIPDFLVNAEYQMYYLAVFDPVSPPYCVFRRYKREAELDLQSNYGLVNSSYVFEINHTNSWALLDLQERIRKLLEKLPLTTVGGMLIRSLIVLDDYHTIPDSIQEARVRTYQGILDVRSLIQRIKKGRDRAG